MTHAYYNENDSFAAAWLRELIKVGLIADGEVDERSIEEVKPDELRGFTQCHFFAGIGVWSYALRKAGWPDDLAVWTGSCPCQGFSASGKRGGFPDKRHLWPAWFRLIRECIPVVCFGEQVASKDGLAWFDVVSADMEGAGYTIGAADICAAGIGAPMLSQRVYFVAQTNGEQLRAIRPAKVGGAPRIVKTEASQWQRVRPDSRQRSIVGILGATDDTGPQRQPALTGTGRGQLPVGPPSSVSRMAQTNKPESGNGELQRSRRLMQSSENPLTGFWANAEWIYCQDDKWRPVEPGTFPLAHGAPARVGRLRGYGNALCAPQAQAFIEAYLEVQS